MRVGDPYKCKALANQGSWLDAPDASLHGNSFQSWQAPGCLLHEYKDTDLVKCLASRRVVYIGDSTIRQIFWATAKKLDLDGAEADIFTAERHEDLKFSRHGVSLEYIWDPYLNSTKLHMELATYRHVETANSASQEKEVVGAAMLLVGGGLWHARHIEGVPLEHFRNSIDRILSFIDFTGSTQLQRIVSSPSSNNPTDGDAFFLAPVQSPFYRSLSAKRAAAITPARLDPINEYMQQLSEFQGVPVLWSYAPMTWNRSSAYEVGGIHVIEAIASKKADILLNLKCNAAATVHGYPYDRTCCIKYSRPSWVQWLLLMSPIILIPMALLSSTCSGRQLPMLPSAKISRAMLILALALCYCFVADRTHIFEKLHKVYSPKEFKDMCIIVFLLGLLSLRRSSPRETQRGLSAFPAVPDQHVLSRDQTDEWKGWMQFLILIYHYTGASKVLDIYEVIRLLVASYLFMTGFGHTVYFHQRGDYSFQRFASVLVRMNLLSCLLPYMMHTDYLFYYFAPLVSFWFVVIYFTMRFDHARNKSLSFLICKIMVSASATTVFIKVPGILEGVFSALKLLCHIQWNLMEWRFRVFLDMYIVYVGMIAGILFVRLSEVYRIDHPDTGVLYFIRHHLSKVKAISVICVLAVLPGYYSYAKRARDKYTFNRRQPYLSCLPILVFVVLRNSNRHFRNFYSLIFAWLGRCSLETFTLQFHIWMAGDTKGLLGLGISPSNRATPIGGRWQEFIVITSIFLWASWHVSIATSTITTWIIDSKVWKQHDDLNDSRIGEQLRRPKCHQDLEHKGRYQGNLRLVQSGSRYAKAMGEDLRVRVAVIMATMWFLNMTYQ